MAKVAKTILIAEDEDVSRAFLREVLLQAGYKVLEAADGQQAFEMLQKEKADLLITDRAMPGLGGLDLLKKLKENKITVPSLMVSAYGEESFWGKAVGFGAQDYILKPFKAEQVLSVVSKIFKGEKSQ